MNDRTGGGAPSMVVHAAVLAGLLLAGCSEAPQGLDVETATGGNVTGQVLNEAGFAVGGVRISILGTDHFTETGGDGRFAVLNVTAGTRTVALQHRDYLPVEQEVTVVPGETANLTVRLFFDPTKSSNPHLHAYWPPGRDMYTLMDADVDVTQSPPWDERFTPVEDPVFGAFAMPNGVSRDQFWIPLLETPEDGPAIVLPGAVEMHVTLTWDTADIAVDAIGLRYDTPRSREGPLPELPPQPSGETFVIPLEADMTDRGHKQFTRWRLYGFHDNRIDDPGSWTPAAATGPLHVTIELARGDVPQDDPHREFWGSSTSIVLRNFGDPTQGTVSLSRGAGSLLRLADGAIVPPGTAWLEAELRWTFDQANGTGARGEYDLAWRTTGMNPQTTRWEDFVRDAPTEGSGAEQWKRYEITLDAFDADGYYDESSNWEFRAMVTDVPERAYWPSVGGSFDLRVVAHLDEAVAG